jgi:hypothetical protein
LTVFAGGETIVGMNWLKLITLILQTADVDLPAIEALIEGIKGATPQHQATVNKAVSAALTK